MSGRVNWSSGRVRRKDDLVYSGGPRSFVRDGIDHGDHRRQLPEWVSVIIAGEQVTIVGWIIPDLIDTIQTRQIGYDAAVDCANDYRPRDN